MKLLWLSLLILVTTSVQTNQPTNREIMNRLAVMQKELDVCCETTLTYGQAAMMQNDLEYVVRFRKELAGLEMRVKVLEELLEK